MGRALSAAAKQLLIAIVRAYQLAISPLLPPACRYYPSCSAYAIEALREYGLPRGAVLTGWRLLRCNPWSHGGVDFAHEQRLFRRRARKRAS